MSSHVVILNFRLFQEGDVWVAHCPDLDLATQGPTMEAAVKNAREATELYMESCIERGVLERILVEAGFIEPTAPPTREHPQFQAMFQTRPLPLTA